MKLVSKLCQICHEPIFFQTEGIWCEKCQTTFHKKCIIDNQKICSTCSIEIVYPEDPLNLKRKKWHEGVAKYPKEYWYIVCAPVISLIICIIAIAWYFLSREAFGIFIILFAIFSLIFEALFTPLLWKFDDWILEKIERKKKRISANSTPK